MSELDSAGLDDGRVLHSPGTHQQEEEEEEEEERGDEVGHHQSGLSWHWWLDSLEKAKNLSSGSDLVNWSQLFKLSTKLVNCRSG